VSEETLDDFIKRLQEKQTDLEIKKKEVQGKINDLRVEIGKLETALESAEKILEKKFENPAEQEKLVSEHLKNIHLN